MSSERFTLLFERYKNNLLTEPEILELRILIQNDGYDNEIIKQIGNTLSSGGLSENWTNETGAEVWKNIEKTLHPPVRLLFIRYWRQVAVAAAVVLLAGTIAYYKTSRKNSAPRELANVSVQDVLPGGNKAFLTLSNGKQIILDSLHNGLVTVQGNSNIRKMNNGQLIYTELNEKPSDEVVLNTLSTPRGGQYQLTLPDGTIVWLNAASSIRYPTAFTGNKRMVDITGEAYFEVAKNASKPFIVSILSTNDQLPTQIEVLGTNFNVNAYDDEAETKTTLIQGSIALLNKQQRVMLKPGEQALLGKSGNISVVNNEDIDQVLAWKNGFFKLTSAGIPDVLRQIARWYDITVVYENGIPEGHLTGNVSRNLNLSEIVKVMKLSGFNIRITDKKLIVSQ